MDRADRTLDRPFAGHRGHSLDRGDYWSSCGERREPVEFFWCRAAEETPCGLDGTWNSVNSNTNVWRMRALCATKSQDGKPQLVYYEIGVNGFLGGVFGQGLDENIRLAHEWLVENYNDGDEIFIFGFSRGAFTARALAGLVAIDGILKAGSPIGVTELFERYRKGNEESIWRLKEMQASGDTSKLTEQERWLIKYSQPADVKVIGVWDTVGSVGVAAGNIPGISRSQFDYLQTGLRIHILNGYHALAVDEHRPDFAPTIWDVRHPKDPNAIIAQPRPLSGVEQRWFVGAHANVGGQNGLSQDTEQLYSFARAL
jgi:uncharacterized protein (DUF2235 family)